MRNAHILFLKYPEAGKVKTRLAKDLGDITAAEFYKKMVESTIFANAVPDIDMLLFIEPYGRLADFESWLGDGFGYFPQEGADLGERMYNALRTVFDEGYESCVLTGSDIPALNSDILLDGFEKLGKSDAVLGETVDGGYYLIGFNKERLTEAPFKDMVWSTDSVFSETVQKLDNAGVTTEMLTKLSDLDDISDMIKLEPYIDEILDQLGLDIDSFKRGGK